MYSCRIVPDKLLDNANLPEMFRELHNYKTIWERKRFLYDGYLVYLNPNYIGWEIKITKADAEYYFISTNESDKSILQKCFPGCEVRDKELMLADIESHKDNYNVCELELKYHYFMSLSTDKKQLEPIASILDIQKILKEDDFAVVQYIFCPEAYDWSAACSEAYEKFKDGVMPTQLRLDKKELIGNCARALAKVALGTGELVQELILEDPRKIESYKITDSNVAKILKDQPLRKATMEKAKHNAYMTTIRLISHSKNINRRDQIKRGLTVSFNTVRLDNYLLPKNMDLSKDYIDKLLRKEPGLNLIKNILTTEEVAKLCLMPQITLQNTYKMETIDTREVIIPDVLLNGKIPIGTAKKNGRVFNVTWENKYDIITLPKVTVGGMGNGKSKFTAVFAANAVKEGHSVIVPDYIRECQLSKEIERHVPKDKTVILDISNYNEPFSFAYNEIKITDNMTKQEKIKNASDLSDQTSYLINALNDGSVQPLTPKMIRIFYSACMVTYVTGRAKVYDVICVLQNHKIRHQVIDDAVNKGVYTRNDFRVLDLLSIDDTNVKGVVIGTNESRIESIMDRINILLRNPYLEMMLMADPDENVNFINYMNEGKVVLIRMPESTFKKKWIKDVVLSYFMSRIWLAALMRNGEEKPRITHILTDEIHQVPTAAKIVAETITESRKFGVGYFFTCHSFAQFKSLLDGVKGAGASYVLLAGADKENFQLLKEECGEFSIEELLQMKEFHSFNIIKTSNGTKRFISKLPRPLEK